MVTQQTVFFFIGTEAELIKVFPVMIELESLGVEYKIIASGQNNIVQSSVLKVMGNKRVDLELSEEREIRKSTTGLIKWFFKTKRGAATKIRNKFPNVDFNNTWLIVHGDTISTVMGALIGKKLKMTVVHIEAGLRSYNFLSPFPEEIDRLIVSTIANFHFVPGQAACKNLIKKRNVVNTQYNTIYDALQFSLNIPNGNKTVNELKSSCYCVLVLHRQENLANAQLLCDVVEETIEIAKKIKCVFILHKPTEITLIKHNLLNRLKENKNVIILPRMDYFDFMKLLLNAQFVITDGGSNQEELHYMGKPCLIIRKRSERAEGLGQNAELYAGDISKISAFLGYYKDKTIEAIHIIGQTPSQIIADTIHRELQR